MGMLGAFEGSYLGGFLGDEGDSSGPAFVSGPVPSVSLEIVEGELEDPLLIALVNAAGAAADVSDAISQITMHWRKPDGTLVIVNLSSADLSQGLVYYTWAAGDTDIVGIHRAQVVVPRTGGEQIFPMDDRHYRWVIHAALS